MKKYLMTGIAAIAMSAAFTSCGNDEITPMTEGDIARAKYEMAFVQTFGKVSPNQTWGFGTTSNARTRANAGDDFPATSDGINANANEWADPNKEFGGWVVPDALTPEQKEIVTAYFQTVNTMSYTDPEWRHFFVQQVYGGGNTTVRNTTEGIIAANGSEYTSANMNLLTVGENHQHINNFNGGTCSVNNDVLDNGSNVNENKHHSDQIMLMVNIDDTSCFGYHETGSSTHHDNKAALVSWQTIRTWANANGFNGELLNDGWDRSFLGFDLAIQEGEQAMDGTATYDQAPESPEYAWDGEKIIRITTGEWKNVTIEHEYWTENKSVPVYVEGYESIFGLGFLTTNENFYKAGAKETISQTISINRAQLSSLTEIQNCVVLKEVMDGDQWYQSVINLPRIKQLVDEGYLPVKDNSLTEWVKPGVSDGYFSDWIVTLTEAKRIDNGGSTGGGGGSSDEVYDGRIIAEDLSATQSSDFDFNDVVFDWKITSEGAKIQLLAAGGTLSLYVGGTPNEDKTEIIGGHEVHQEFGVSVTTMVNTGVTEKDVPDPFILSGITSAADIKIWVKKGNEYEELTANQGTPACKINVPVGTKWVDEYVNINKAYTDFDNYVQNNVTPAWGSPVARFVDQILGNNSDNE